MHQFMRMVCGIGLAVVLASAWGAAAAMDKHYTVMAPDGVTLAVQEAGDPDGPAIVFIHGLLGSRLNWTQQISSPALQRYRMITYDLRGHGLSDQPQDAEAYRDGRRYADDLSAVLKASGAGRPALVGWSLGGVVISNYLAAYGDAAISGAVYVDGVIELSAPLITPHPAVYAGLASIDLQTHLDAIHSFLALCFHVPPDSVTVARLQSNAAMASWVMTRTTPSMTVHASAGLPKATVPLLAIYGAQDALVQVEPSLSRARQLNPRLQSLIYADSGHAPFIEEPARFNHDLASFMKTLH